MIRRLDSPAAVRFPGSGRGGNVSRQTLDDGSLALNLSHVLREPSTSRTVRSAVRDSRRFSRRCGHLTYTFTNLSDDEVIHNLVIHPALAKEISGTREISLIITASVGLPVLLPRAISLVRGTTDHPELVTIDSASGTTPLAGHRLFGQPAWLAETTASNTDTSVLVSGLVLRPGERALMLVGGIVGPKADFEAQVSPLLEAVIRDYVDQWIPGRTLWDFPAEQSDKTILINSATENGF